MSLLGTLLKTTIHAATLPIDIVKDVVTMGGVLTDDSEPATVKKASQLMDDIEEIEDDVSTL